LALSGLWVNMFHNTQKYKTEAGLLKTHFRLDNLKV
jgi:hypothetical protein